MSRRPHGSSPGLRRRRGTARQRDRRVLESDGWRTTLEYRENHVRGRDGRLRQLQVEWHAVGERAVGDDPLVVISATGSTVGEVWSQLRLQAELADVPHRGGRRAPMAVTA